MGRTSKKPLKPPEYDALLLKQEYSKKQAINKSPDHSHMMVIVIDDRTSIVRPLGTDPDVAREEYLKNYTNRKHVINDVV